ncbi:MAG TPA: PhzF family phenazine biosynthesis protein, partial [Rhodocyclaceae bacterium]|nr:PhzF family phenazine biosynthesis protein [Rhodocyclaceae bacterium]
DFSTRSGKVSVIRRNGMLWLDFPSWDTKQIEIDARLVAALGARPRLAFQNRDLLAVFDTEQEVRNLAPDYVRLAELDTLGVMVTAPGTECDFVSRFFAPAAGIPEDPVTGSAHCTLGPYWAARLGKSVLHARQISGRGGDLHCEVLGARTLIGGNTVEYLRGEIRLP